jgi:hypothetical protein
MPQLRLIDGAGWGALDGQLVTTTNSGPSSATRLTGVTAGGWTFRAANGQALPLGSASTGYIESAPGAQTILQIDPTGTALSGGPPPSGNNTDYWIDFWVQGVWDGATALPANQGDYLVTAITGSYGYVKLYCNGAAAPGWTAYAGNSASTPPSFLYTNPSSTGSCTALWGQWQRLTIHFKYGASGLVEVFQNGALLCSVVTDTTAITWSAQSLQLKTPAWAGVQWRVAGPIQTYNGTDIVVRPLFALDDQPGSLVTKVFVPFGVAVSGGQTQGAYFISSGSGAVATDAEYGTSGNTPFRHRLVFSGNGSTPVATTIDELGALPYNEQGWGHVVLSDASVPTGTTLQLQLNKAGGGSELIRFVVTGGSLYAAYNGGPTMNVAPWTHSLRYALALHLNRDGRACFTLVDITTSPMTGSIKTLWSGPLQQWTPQPLGTARLTATTTTANVETGFLALCRRPTFSTVDSLTAAQYSGVTPAIRTSANVARSFPFGQESWTIPGGYYPFKEVGLERRVVIAPLGASGLSRREWMQMAGAAMAHTRGIEVLAIDGGSINDIAAIQMNDATNILDALSSNIERFIQLCIRNDNAVWFATMLPRTRNAAITAASNASPIVLTVTGHGISGTTTRAYVSGVAGNTAANGFYASVAITDANTITLTGSTGNGTYSGGGTIQGYTPAELAAISALNASLRRLVVQFQAKGLLTLSDVEADAARNPASYPNSGGTNGFWQDFTHPNFGPPPAGSGLIAQRMVLIRGTTASRFPARRWSRAQ